MNSSTQRAIATVSGLSHGGRSLRCRVSRLSRAQAVRPAVATRQVLAATTGLLYLTGGLLVLIAVAGTGDGPAQRVPLGALGSFAVLVGLLTLFWGRALPRWAYHGLVGAGTLVITALVYFSGGGASAQGYGCLYTFVAIDCFFFFAWPVALLHLAGFQLASVLAFAALGTPWSQTVVEQGCATVVALVVGWLARAATAAEQDSLTELMNRRGFDRALQESVSHAQQTDVPLCLLLLDLDHFKTINDTGGHASGDDILLGGGAELGAAPASRSDPGAPGR